MIFAILGFSLIIGFLIGIWILVEGVADMVQEIRDRLPPREERKP